MRIVFTERDGYMTATPGSITAMDAETPVVAADFWRDVLREAEREYDRARVRCGWEPVNG